MAKHTYIGFYRGKQAEVSGENMTALQARDAVALKVRAKHAWDVAVVLAAKDDVPVVHVAVD